jgi:hypothetical protein
VDDIVRNVWLNPDGSYKRKAFEDRLQQLIRDRDPWLDAWIDLRDYILPTRGMFDGVKGRGDQANRGKKIDHTKILDGSPARASRILASGMMSGLTSPSRPWFRLGLRDFDLMKYKPVKQYLADIETRIFSVFSGSNIYGALYSTYEEIGTFATSAFALLVDRKDVIRARMFTIGEYMLDCDSEGRVNTFARTYTQNVGQVVGEFGLSNCRKGTQNQWRQNQRSGPVHCYHMIIPNDFRNPEMRDNQNMEWLSVYWEESAERDRFLDVSGFRSFPILCPRWDVVSNDPYGRGAPGWFGLGDTKMLQKMQRDKLVGLEKTINPPMQADASVEGKSVHTIPGGLTRSSSLGVPNAGIKPAYQVQLDFQAIGAEIAAARQSIMETYYADIFMMVSQQEGPEMTAREIAERHEEKLMQLGPVLERLEAELLDPLILRTYQIMEDAHLLPEPPEELKGVDVEIEYISMLAQAQQMVGTQKLKEHVAFVGAMAQAIPDALDNLDADKAAEHHAEMIGVQPDVQRSPEERDQMRQQRAKAQQAAATAAAAQQGADAANKLGNTPIGTNSVLDKIIENAGGDTTAPPGVDPNAPA